MWRPVLEQYAPSEAKYVNGTRNYNGALYLSPPGNLTTLNGWRSRLEVMESVDDGRKQSMKPCRHYTRSVDHPLAWFRNDRSWYSSTHTSPNPGWWTWNYRTSKEVWDTLYTASVTPKTYFGAWEDPSKDLPVLASGTTLPLEYNLFPTVDVTQRNLLVQRALASMLPGIRAAVSLPNTLYELKDFRTVQRSIDRINVSLDSFRDFRSWNWRGTLRNATKVRRGSPLRKILRGAADSYLQASFNLLPLLNDMAKLRRGLKNLWKDLDGLVSRAESRQRRHFTCPLDGFSDSTDVQTLATPTFVVVPTVTCSRAVRYDIRKFNATMVYSYSVPTMSKDLRVLLALLDRVGINLNPAIIWNAIPWSFVVDWFVGVSQWLSQFQLKNIEPAVHIEGFCYSLHVVRSNAAQITGDGNAGVVTHVSEDAYERVVGLDQASVTSSIRSSGLNLKEFILSTALALSR